MNAVVQSSFLLGKTEVRRKIEMRALAYQAEREAEAAERIRQEAEAEAERRQADSERQAAALNAYLDSFGAADIASRQIRIRAVLRAVAEKYGVQPSDLLGPSRLMNIAHARHEAVWTIRNTTRLSLNEIGRLFAGRDHTTILNSIRRHKARLDAAASGDPA